MKKNNLTGWRDVFSFTLVQTLKSKAYIGSLIFFLILSMASLPVIKMITSKNSQDPDAISPIIKVYVDNETSLPDMDFSGVLKEKALSRINFVKMQESYDTVSKRIEKFERTSVILTIKENENGYSLNFVKAGKGSVKKSSLQSLGDAVTSQFETLRIHALGITDEQNTMLNSPVESKVTMADVNGNAVVKKNTSISGSEYWFIYGILFIILMVNSISSGQIATSIVTEKSTKVVEYLLITVKPLALMVGKILAALVAVLIQMGSMIAAIFVSNRVSSLITSDKESIFSQYLPKNIFQNLNIVNLLVCLILIALGLIFYATLAGLAGATVSKLEEISEGLTLYTFTTLIGAYVGIGAASTLMGSGMNGFVTFSFLFPLSSPFILPGAVLIGKANLLIAAAAIALLVIFNILLFRFVAKVYETLILHNGNRIKMKDLFRMSKAS